MRILQFRKIVSVVAILAFGSVPAIAQDMRQAIAAALETLGAGFEAGDLADFNAALAAAPAGVSGDTFGHLLFTRRQFDKAAWFFGTDALADPDDAASLNNMAAMLLETAAAGAGAPSWARPARLAAEAAVALHPEVAAYNNTLGNAARAQADWGAAVEAAGRATELAPDEPLYWANLARALDAAGDPAAAAAALARAHALEPNGVPALLAARTLPAIGTAYRAQLGQSCKVNFRCQEICPRSIIGGLMSVTCEIENASAQMACQAGEPYATAYDCREELPEYGILIPGLNAGFSLAVPGFSVHVLVNGEGKVDVRAEAGISAGPLGGYLRGDGHYSPSNGASFDNLGGGVRVSILPGAGSSEAARIASALGHPPAHIEMETLDGGPAKVNIETYNAGVISF
ncbi:MAG: hypothetical protein Q8J98_09510 [Phaeovulum sp.]|uniref:hypothetical protein n=1 Tax=Phaeovulum sp. TaxID=2934796 RepID=UPI002731E0AF|nr:hypothetical protein [Phaeovulum sp.]MDP2063324.1 hypothetical protein [Phaeovulum sp.]